MTRKTLKRLWDSRKNWKSFEKRLRARKTRRRKFRSSGRVWVAKAFLGVEEAGPEAMLGR
jgi:hypothetical protein